MGDLNNWVPLKTARVEKVKAEFWIEPNSAKNISVKWHEDANTLGHEARYGDFLLKGILKVQPKGYTWSMEQPFSLVITLHEEPTSGTLFFKVKGKKGTGVQELAQMVDAAITLGGYGLEDKIMRLLGDVPPARR